MENTGEAEVSVPSNWDTFEEEVAIDLRIFPVSKGKQWINF